jgi:hypothetical protein
MWSHNHQNVEPEPELVNILVAATKLSECSTIAAPPSSPSVREIPENPGVSPADPHARGKGGD